MISPDDFSFTFDKKDTSPREAYRVSLPGLAVRVIDNEVLFPVLNISAGGVLFQAEGAAGSMSLGLTLTANLELKGKLVLQEVTIKVVRIREQQVAGQFQGLSYREEARLDKLILEIQKMRISKNRQKESNKEDNFGPDKT